MGLAYWSKRRDFARATVRRSDSFRNGCPCWGGQAVSILACFPIAPGFREPSRLCREASGRGRNRLFPRGSPVQASRCRKSLLVRFEKNLADLTVSFRDLSDGEKCFFICAAVLAANRSYGPIFCFWGRTRKSSFIIGNRTFRNGPATYVRNRRPICRNVPRCRGDSKIFRRKHILHCFAEASWSRP